MGPEERSLDAVHRKLGKSTRLIAKWSSRWRWVERTMAYDEFLRAKRAAAEAAALKEKAIDWAARQQQIRERDFEQGERMRARVDAILNFPLATQTTSRDGKTVHIHPAKFSIQSAARMLDTASKLQRLSAGMMTEKTELVGPGNTPIVGTAPAQVVIFLPDNGRDKPKEKKKDKA